MNIFDLQATIGLNGEAFMDGISEAQSAFDGFNSSISSGAVALGNVIADMVKSAAGALKEFAGSIVDTGMQFGASMSNVKAISGASQEEFEALSAKAQEMGATTKFTATQAADAFSYMAMAGWDAEEMMSGIEGIMNLAAASGADLATTSDIVTDALTAFGLKAEDSAHFADVLAAASSAANTNVEMMGETFKYVAPVAGALNYSIEDMATAIGTMANSGIKGSQTGTALRSALSRLVDPTKEVNEALGALGLILHTELPEGFEFDTSQFVDELAAAQKASDDLAREQADYDAVLAESGYESEKTAKAYDKVTKAQQKLEKANRKLKEKQDEQINAATSYNAAILDQNGNMRDFSDTISILRDAFSDLSDAEKARYASQIFGQQAMSGMLALLNTSNEDYSALAGTIASASFDMDAFTESVVNSGVEWEKYADKIWEVRGLVDEAASALSKGFSAEEVADYLHFEYDVDAEDAIAAVEALQEAMETSAGTSERMANIMQDNLAGAKTLFDSAMDGFKLSLYTYLEEPLRGITEFGTGVLSDLTQAINEGGIAGAFSALGDILKDRLNPYLEGLKTALNFDNLPFIDNFIEIAKSLWGAFKDFQSIKFDAIVTFVREFIDAFKQSGAPESVSSIVGNVLEFLKAFSGKVAEFVEAAAKSVQEFVGAFIQNGGVDAIVNIVDSALKFFGVLTDTIASIILDVADAVVDFIGAFDNEAAGKLIADIVSGISDFVDVVLDVAGDILENIAANVKKLFEAFKESGAAQKITELAGAVAEFFKPFTDALRVIIERIGDYVEKILDVLTTAMTGVIAESPDLIDSIKDALEKLTPIVKAAWDMWKSFSDFLDGILTPILDHLGTSIKVSFELVLDTLQLVFDLLGDIADFVVNVLQGDFEGAAEAIEDAWGHIVEFFQSIWDGIVEVFASAWDTFIQIGENMGKALREGFMSMIKGIFGWDPDPEGWNKFTAYVEAQDKMVSEGYGIAFGLANPSEFKQMYQSNYDAIYGASANSGTGVRRRKQNITGTATQDMSTGEILYSDSAIGQASAAGINSTMLGGGGKTIDINLVLDSDVVASAVYDPLQDVAFQRGGR